MINKFKKNIVLDANCAFEKKKWISLTGLCNNNCLFCLDNGRTDKFHMDPKKIKEEIKKSKEEENTKLILSGGDPTIHPNIIDFVKYAKELNYNKIQVITNGRMFASKKFTEDIINAGLDEVTFSIHGYNAEMHDSLTRVPGSFRQTLKGAKNVFDNQKKMIVNTDTCITKSNYKYLPKIIKFIVEKAGITEVNLMSIVPQGNAWKYKAQVMYDYAKVAPYVHKVIDYCVVKGVVLWLSRFPAEYLEGYEGYIESYKKLLDDVVACGEGFFSKTPLCFGEGCHYCNINGICDSLVSGVYTKFTPPCESRVSAKIDKEIIKRGGKAFGDFAEEICLNSRVKLLSCKKCIFNDSCNGVLREKIRKQDFKIVKPIINQN